MTFEAAAALLTIALYAIAIVFLVMAAQTMHQVADTLNGKRPRRPSPASGQRCPECGSVYGAGHDYVHEAWLDGRRVA